MAVPLRLLLYLRGLLFSARSPTTVILCMVRPDWLIRVSPEKDCFDELRTVTYMSRIYFYSPRDSSYRDSTLPITLCLFEKRVRKMVDKSLGCSIYIACTHNRVSSNGKSNTDRTATIYHFPPQWYYNNIYTMYILLLCIKPPTASQTSSICFFYYSFILIILHNIVSFPLPSPHHHEWQSIEIEFFRTSSPIYYNIIVSSRPYDNYFFTAIPRLPITL